MKTVAVVRFVKQWGCHIHCINGLHYAICFKELSLLVFVVFGNCIIYIILWWPLILNTWTGYPLDDGALPDVVGREDSEDFVDYAEE